MGVDQIKHSLCKCNREEWGCDVKNQENPNTGGFVLFIVFLASGDVSIITP